MFFISIIFLLVVLLLEYIAIDSLRNLVDPTDSIGLFLPSMYTDTILIINCLTFSISLSLISSRVVCIMDGLVLVMLHDILRSLLLILDCVKLVMVLFPISDTIPETLVPSGTKLSSSLEENDALR